MVEFVTIFTYFSVSKRGKSAVDILLISCHAGYLLYSYIYMTLIQIKR